MSKRWALGGRVTGRVTGGRVWVTSAVAVIAVAGTLAGTMLANAASPALPGRTPAQLLVDMQHASPPSAFSGVITENANLGLPSVPNIGGLSSPALSAAAWISGTHTVDVWYGGPSKVRIAVPVSFGETDLRVDGNQIWLWDSHGQTATHYLPAAPFTRVRTNWIRVPSRVLLPRPALRPVLGRCMVAIVRAPGSKTQRALLRQAAVRCLRQAKLPVGAIKLPAVARPARNFSATPLTPQQVASKILAAVGPSTKVSVGSTVVVAGRSAYQLVISPRTDQSLIGRIVIAVDAKTYVPLQVQVFAAGASSPAFSVGFTSLTIGQPAASNFTFTPPAGAHVRTEPLPSLLPGLAVGGVARFGPPVRVLPRMAPVLRGISLRSRAGVHWIIATRRLAILRIVKQGHAVVKLRTIKYVPISSAPSAVQVPASMPAGPLAGAGMAGLQMLGQGWLSVAVLPVNLPLGVIAGAGMPANAKAAGQHPAGIAIAPGAQGQSAAQLGALIHVLLNAATPVHGAWGRGRLLRTNLFSALITNQGKVLIGAVTPAVLYADAAKVK